MFVLTISEKIKETRQLFQRSVTVLQMMVNYKKARVTLTNLHLSKLKAAAKK